MEATSIFSSSIDSTNILTTNLQVQAPSLKNMTLAYDSSSNLYLTQTGVSGYLQFMPNSTNPQILAGKSNTTGAFYIDIYNGRPMYLNGLKLGLVETGGNLIVDGNLTALTLTGSGNAYACLDSTGKLYRSATACTQQ